MPRDVVPGPARGHRPGPDDDPRIHLLGVVSLNGGDAAILDAEVQILLERWPGARITVHDRDPVHAARYAPHRDFVGFLGAEVDHPTNSRSFKGARRVRRVLARVRSAVGAASPRLRWVLPAALRDVDLAIYTGGTSLTENYALAGKLRDLEMVRRVGIPYAFFPQSAGPFHDPTNLSRLAPVLAGAALVMLRDERSLHHVLAAGAPPERCVVVPDVVFALARHDLEDRPVRAAAPERVAVSVREWRFFTSRSPREGREATVSAFRGLVSTLVRERGAHVTFVSTCQGRPEYAYDDSVFAREIVAGLDDDVASSVEVDGAPHGTTDLVERFAGFDVLVSMRLHAAILAVCSGLPTLTVAYEYKSTEVWSQLGQQAFTLDLETLDGEELVAAVVALLDHRDEVRADLAPRVSAFRDEALGLGEVLGGALARAPSRRSHRPLRPGPPSAAGPTPRAERGAGPRPAGGASRGGTDGAPR